MLTVATWNVDRSAKTKGGKPAAAAYMADIAPDVALMQELPLGRWRDAPGVVRIVMPTPEIDSRRRWGSAVLSYGPALDQLTEVPISSSKGKPMRLLQTDPGSVAIAVVGRPSIGKVVLVSVYALMHGGNCYATLHKQFSDISYLLDSPLRHNIIVGGDFNHAFGGRWRELYRNLFDRLRLLGLVDLLHHTRSDRLPADCYCGEPDCGHVATLKYPKSKRPCDYLFATKPLVDRLVSCDVPDDGGQEAWRLSRHRPVIGAFDI